MHGQLVAMLNRCADIVDVGEIQTGVHALDIHIERHIHHVQIAGALAVAEQTAFQAVRASHQGQLRCCRPRAAVVMRVDRDHHAVTALDVAMRPLHHVGKDIGRGMLHGGGQVDDALVLGRGLPDVGDGVYHALGELQLGVRIHFGRVLEGPFGVGVLGRDVLEHLGIGHRQFNDLVFTHIQHHTAHHGSRGVVEMDDGAGHAFQRFESATNQVLTRLGQHLYGHVVGNTVFLDELAHEVELDLRGRRKADFDFLETDLHQLLEHAHLALDVHGLDQGLVAVTQIHAAPDRRLGDDRVGPGAIGQTHGGESAVFGGRVLQHGESL